MGKSMSCIVTNNWLPTVLYHYLQLQRKIYNFTFDPTVYMSLTAIVVIESDKSCNFDIHKLNIPYFNKDVNIKFDRGFNCDE